jgi:hypothetical protein
VAACGVAVAALVMGCGVLEEFAFDFHRAPDPPDAASRDAATSHDAGVGPDGSIEPGGADADADAGTARCSTSARFTRFDAITELNTDADEELPRLSRDERTIYYFRSEADGGTETLQARRTDPTLPFGAPTTIFPELASAFGAAPSANHLRLYFSRRVDDNTIALYLAERASETESFATSNSRLLATTAGVVYLAPALMEAPGAPPRLFVGRRSGPSTPDVSDLWSGDVDELGALKNLTQVDGVNSPSIESVPTPSADGLTLYFSSDREESRHGRIFVAHRLSPTTGFASPTPVDEIVRPVNGSVSPGYLSDDQCRLYYFSVESIGAPADLYVATRSPN